VRAGVGLLRIIDRDLVELSNLQRQVLFDEDDVIADLPKAEAARRKLARINSEVTVEAVVDDANHENIEDLAEGADLLLDGTDNFETRFLINDLAVKTGRPWVYGACVGSRGMSLPILPGDGPCLRCVVDEPPPREMNPTCETAGILGPVVGMVASHQAMEAIKILAGCIEAVDRRMLVFDAWVNKTSHLDVRKAYSEGDCACCKGRQFDYLGGRLASRTVTLCGRNAVQVYPGHKSPVDFAALADKLRPIAKGEPRFNSLLFKVVVETYELTVFPDGRAMIKGVDRPEDARTVYARYIGA
jgi:molybdopterin-synthase adenylyltransferase